MAIRYIITLAVLLLVGSAEVRAQFNAILIHDAPAQPLTTTCEGATPIPDGRLVKIYLDVDSDGPDDTDPQPVECSDPPFCTTPPDGVNFNEFAFNGVEYLGGAGKFYTDPAFTGNGTIPAPGLFYLRVFEVDGTTLLWTSSVFSIQIGFSQFYFTDEDWTCGAVGPQCTVIDESE